MARGKGGLHFGKWAVWNCHAAICADVADMDEGFAPDLRIADVLRTPYRIDRIQPIYYVIDSIDTLFEVAQTDIMSAVRRAMSQGLFAPHPSLAIA